MVKRRERLNEKPQFRDLYQNGQKIEFESFRLLFRQNRLSHSRFGVIVSRKFGSAVCRNQAKRRSRHLFDQFHPEIYPSCDILIFPKKALLERPQEALVEEFKRALMAAEILEEKKECNETPTDRIDYSL